VASSTMAPFRETALTYLPGIDEIETVPTPIWKRAIDIVGAATGLIVLSPFLLLIAIAIMIDSPGGPIYRQVRVGPGGSLFMCWKFRSMRRGADSELAALLKENEANGMIFKMKDDPRRTRIGKFVRRTSIDELPQLWNVLRGNMSLIGPRPPTVGEVLRYDRRHLSRLVTRPGLTGLWQVTLRRERHDLNDMVELDTQYARELSFANDIRILLKTVPTVLGGKGSY